MPFKQNGLFYGEKTDIRVKKSNNSILQHDVHLGKMEYGGLENLKLYL